MGKTLSLPSRPERSHHFCVVGDAAVMSLLPTPAADAAAAVAPKTPTSRGPNLRFVVDGAELGIADVEYAHGMADGDVPAYGWYLLLSRARRGHLRRAG